MKKIPFCVRVPKHHSILLADGQRLWAEKVARSDSTYYHRDVVVDGVVVNLALSYGKDDELLYLIGTTLLQTLSAWYKRRWSIEVFFQALKGRGFDLESSSLRCPAQVPKTVCTGSKSPTRFAGLLVLKTERSTR